MKSDNTAVTDPAMDLIRALDPDTWQQMTDDGTWDVHVLEPDDHGYQVIVDQAITIIDYLAILHALNNGAMGITPQNRPWTDLNMPLIRVFAEELDVPVLAALASILVHEFSHHSRDTGETDAFKAEIAFDRLLGQPAILQDRYEESQVDPAEYGSIP